MRRKLLLRRHIGRHFSVQNKLNDERPRPGGKFVGTAGFLWWLLPHAHVVVCMPLHLSTAGRLRFPLLGCIGCFQVPQTETLANI